MPVQILLVWKGKGRLLPATDSVPLDGWQGDPGSHFFVVKDGTFALKVMLDSETAEAKAQTVKRFAAGTTGDSSFGEIALVSGSKPYGGNIIARSAGAPPSPAPIAAGTPKPVRRCAGDA